MNDENHVASDKDGGARDHQDLLERRALLADRVAEREDDEREPYDRRDCPYPSRVAPVYRRDQLVNGRQERPAAGVAGAGTHELPPASVIDLALRLTQEPQHQEDPDHGPDRQHPHVLAVEPDAGVRGSKAYCSPSASALIGNRLGDRLERLRHASRSGTRCSR